MVLLNWSDARLNAQAWQTDYNEVLPHSSLGYLTPLGFSRHGAASATVAVLLSIKRHCDPTSLLSKIKPKPVALVQKIGAGLRHQKASEIPSRWSLKQQLARERMILGWADENELQAIDKQGSYLAAVHISN
ncbi:MAG: integrase core domain-containing protein [Pirellulaceae bacterium]|nr:integrase core domain-containing protein [Pirellulaceae bacterium]